MTQYPTELQNHLIRSALVKINAARPDVYCYRRSFTVPPEIVIVQNLSSPKVVALHCSAVQAMPGTQAAAFCNMSSVECHFLRTMFNLFSAAAAIRDANRPFLEMNLFVNDMKRKVLHGTLPPVSKSLWDSRRIRRFSKNPCSLSHGLGFGLNTPAEYTLTKPAPADREQAS